MSFVFSPKPDDLEEKPAPPPTRNAADRAKIIALVVAMGVSMAGWLWFLGWIAFRTVFWVAARLFG